MSRKRSEEKTGLSPIQRKACVVMAFCVLAVVLSFLVSWILPAKLGLSGESDLYDPTQYPLDTSLGSILGQESAQGNYINDTVFVGGTQAVSMSKDSSITLNQYAGKDGLKVSQVLRETCVNFADDANSYTIPQAIAKMKPGALLINAARGPVVDSQALADALNSGYLGGAGIDVFETEPPLDPAHPLLHSKNTIVTPHVAFASAESMEARCKIVFDNIAQWMDGHQTNIIL